MNGQYYLIKKVGTKYKFYWAPVSPKPKSDFDDWGVAVVDFSWPTEDPRSKHLRATQLGYRLKPRYQVLRDPKIDETRNCRYRHMCLESNMYSCLARMDRQHPYSSWI